MPRRTIPISDTEIRNTKVQDGKKEKVLYDGSGLQMHIQATGSRIWRFRYKHPIKGDRKFITFGHYPALTLSKAREMTSSAHRLLTSGLDPQFEREKELQAKAYEHSNTFAKIANEFIDKVKSKKVSQNHAEAIKDSLILHVFPYVGKKPINVLEALDFIEALRPMSNKGTLEQLSRVCQRINEVMDYAVNCGKIKYNPAQKISKVFESSKDVHYPTIRPTELPTLIKALAYANIQRKTRALIEFQLHTMTRPIEAVSAQWNHIDFSERVWKIPAKIMKMKKDHTIPLTEPVLKILQFMKSISGCNDLVFPSSKDPKKHMSSSTANTALKRNGFKGVLVAHGMRSIASTYLNENTDKMIPIVKRHRKELIEVCLAHKERDEVRAAYNHAEYIEARRKILNEWSDFILKSAKGFGTISNLLD